MVFRVSFALLFVVVFSAAPAFAQRQSTNDRVTALEQQLAASRSGNIDLLNQITQLRSEMQALRSQIEELQQQLDQQKQIGRNQFLDLDGRLNRLEAGAAVNPQVVDAQAAATMPALSGATTTAKPVATTPAVAKPAVITPAVAKPVSTTPTVQDSPPRVYGDAGVGGDERAAYNAAFDALKAGRYVDSARLFQGFLGAFPNGSYAPNAYYWLGESYYVTQNYALALEEFQALLDRYPTHDKAPGALLKVGLAQYGLRQLDAAEATLAQVIKRYPASDAARTADDRLRAIQLSRVR
jgi:tol-pal system protein YbgF